NSTTSAHFDFANFRIPPIMRRDSLSERKPVWLSAGSWLARAFCGEGETGSPQENATLRHPGAPRV
ncbi:MAG: hypothetical protein ACOYMK_09585, partial [Hyphomonadaceae bacterium]